GIEVEVVDADERLVERLVDSRFDRAFIALHGRGGEDGSLQALLDLLDRPYTGSGALASALAMDKQMSKQMWRGLGLPTPPFMQVTAQTPWEEVLDRVGPVVAIKPNHEGSSIGISRVGSAAEYAQALTLALRYDQQVLAERWIEGAEYTVSILHGEALPVIRVETSHTFYDFVAKYQANDTRYLCPCGLAPADEQKVQSLALAAFAALGCRGWGRIDLLADAADNFWLLEANTVPGLTDHSLVPMAAKAAGLSFEALVIDILATSERER
ncbi:MAG TPA: D-alanine--D-alanine ligase, partial [Pseudomonadales bacterium]|nr:D-alanine--D-alanine ligase [Pseudomonadales bacterium]